MSSPGLPTLTIDVAARRGERGIVVATLLIVPVAISQWSLPPAVLAAGGAFAFVAMVAGFAAIGWTGGGRRLARIVCQSDGRWVLCEAGGRVIEAELSSGSRISPRALWLSWNVRRHRPLLLLPGDIPDADFRRLIVRLRVAPFPATDGNPDAL